MSESIAAKMGAKFLESWPDLVKSDPELLRPVVGSIMGVKIPRKTLDDMVMETMLKFQCNGCDKEFIVMDHQVDTDTLACPHCQEEIEVPELDDEE